MLNKDKKNAQNQGTGWYRYKNVSNSDLLLPFVMKTGRSILKKNEFVEGNSSLQNIKGLQAVANLSYYLNKSNIIKPIQEQQNQPNNQPQLLTEQPISKIEVVNNKQKGLLDVTKKELMEYATLKGIEFNPNWKKKKILEIIRKFNLEQSSHDPLDDEEDDDDE